MTDQTGAEKLDPMDITMIYTADSPTTRQPSPAQDLTWPPSKRLQWKTGVIRAQTGLEITIYQHPGDQWELMAGPRDNPIFWVYPQPFSEAWESIDWIATRYLEFLRS